MEWSIILILKIAAQTKIVWAAIFCIVTQFVKVEVQENPTKPIFSV